MKHALISTMMVGAICVSGSAQSFAEDQRRTTEGLWMMSPQICRGKPWSSTAKAAGWTFDAENSVCRATASDSSMIAKVRPVERGPFIVNVGLQMQKGAIVQLFMDEIAFDLSDNGQTISVDAAIRALVTKSANDVAAVIAEHLGGTVEKFARQMTQRARSLGMTKTTFKWL